MTTVTVTMPYYQVGPDVRRAVLSIVEQAYPHWRLVIVNDADPEPPWQWIDDIDDPRIVRFDLPVNRGRYFADAVIFQACRPELWAMQDPDDYAEPDRFEIMAPRAVEHGAAFAPTWEATWDRLDTSNLRGDVKPGTITHFVGYGSGVISGERIAKVGGFAPQFRIGFDTWIMNAAKLLGPWDVYDVKPLQNKTRRPGSLTSHPDTKMRSPERIRVRGELDKIWRRLVTAHRDGTDLSRPLRDSIPKDLASEVAIHADRLARLL